MMSVCFGYDFWYGCNMCLVCVWYDFVYIFGMFLVLRRCVHRSATYVYFNRSAVLKVPLCSSFRDICILDGCLYVCVVSNITQTGTNLVRI